MRLPGDMSGSAMGGLESRGFRLEVLRLRFSGLGGFGLGVWGFTFRGFCLDPVFI